LSDLFPLFRFEPYPPYGSPFVDRPWRYRTILCFRCPFPFQTFPSLSRKQLFPAICGFTGEDSFRRIVPETVISFPLGSLLRFPTRHNALPELLVALFGRPRQELLAVASSLALPQKLFFHPLSQRFSHLHIQRLLSSGPPLR